MATGRVPTTANSPLTTKGDLFGYSTAPARLAVGSDGETIVADSSTATGLRYQGSQAGGKNYLINGAMEFFQRGSISAAGYALDRWKTTSYGTSWNSLSFTQGTTTPPEGFRYYMRVAAGSSTTTNIGFGQALETTDVVKFANKTVTLSFYYRVNTNFSSAWTVTPVYSTGTDADIANVPNGTAIGSSQTITNTTSWTRFTYSFTVPSTATSFAVQFFNSSNTVSTASLDITGVQLEIGSVATTFQRAGGTIQGELAACQRYFQAYSGDGTAAYVGTYWTSTESLGTLFLKQTMRVAPSVTASGITAITAYAAGTARTSTAVNFDAINTNAFNIDAITSAATAGWGSFNRFNGAGAYIWVSAEL